MDNFDPYNVFLAIATNIPQRLKTGFVLQGHIFHSTILSDFIKNILICVLKMNEGLMGLERHEGE